MFFIQPSCHRGPIVLSKCVTGLCGVVPGSSGFRRPCCFLCTKSWSVLVICCEDSLSEGPISLSESASLVSLGLDDVSASLAASCGWPPTGREGGRAAGAVLSGQGIPSHAGETSHLLRDVHSQISRVKM